LIRKKIGFMLCFTVLGAEEVSIGETYDILEPNPIIEIKTKIRKDKDKINKKIDIYKKESVDKLNNMQNSFDANLTQATKDNVWKIDTSFTLEYDIPDGKGGYLYKKGYKFDPKDYLKLSKNIVILDGSSKKQVAWAIEKDLFRNRHFKILLTGGKIVKLMKKVHSTLYFYTKEVHKRFKLKHTPTIVRQETDHALYAYEFDINKKEIKK